MSVYFRKNTKYYKLAFPYQENLCCLIPKEMSLNMSISMSFDGRKFSNSLKVCDIDMKDSGCYFRFVKNKGN